MRRLVVAEHAFKHGLNEESIRYVWENRMASQHRKAPYEDQVVAIGLTEDGRVVELIGSQKPSAVVIYHAMENLAGRLHTALVALLCSTRK